MGLALGLVQVKKRPEKLIFSKYLNRYVKPGNYFHIKVCTFLTSFYSEDVGEICNLQINEPKIAPVHGINGSDKI